LSRERFSIAPGLEGAVMIVFTLSRYDYVFKVIKDRPCFLRSSHITNKVISREEVRRRYKFVSNRDRVGRLVDTQEFENVRFKVKRYDPELLREFELAAKNSVTFSDGYVIIEHSYLQRKVTPLPTYLFQERDTELIRRVVIDFGYFIKDLAAAGLFPADLFNTWNYGVTEGHRVVLFDYDDVVPLEDVNFRLKPRPRDEYEETEEEANWISAEAFDFFIDEIGTFLGIPDPLRGTFYTEHRDLFTLDFWETVKSRVSDGEIIDIIPYDRRKRFRGRTREA
jgi:isocitrate dehydrogenase kinase/phosphatase